ncbi:vomeronasal type-1 receptor 1-like [Phascolarctos cinereus]|uniref:Vomeronasal type-1 receptor n=1 Tax=Phascolarctos cinereus TaxID=38626 RepID=A0A6P5JB82_PHACI|nr:vomeronasal type-1 receptor 1-like [Phascolarctos cinereus]
MIASNNVLGVFFLSQTGVGALGNSFILVLYTITFFIGHRLRPIDLIITHLVFVNDLVLLSRGIPYTMSAFGLLNFMNDLICKFFIYLHRVARGLSLCTTCLLGSVQAITISSGSFRGGQLKTQVPKYIFLFILFCWTFHLLTNYILLEHISNPKTSKNVIKIIDFGFCTFAFLTSVNISLYIFVISLFDVVCMAIMVWTGGYMILFLCRHDQRIQYIHSSKIPPRGSPKTRATQTILPLVSFFVFFYSLNSIFSWYTHHINLFPWMVNYSGFLAACSPAFSPFVLIINDSKVSMYFLTLWRMIKPQS